MTCEIIVGIRGNDVSIIPLLCMGLFSIFLGVAWPKLAKPRSAFALWA